MPTAHVNTVLGPVEPAALGRILHHEHLSSLVPGPWLSGGYPFSPPGGDAGRLETSSDDPTYFEDQVRQATGALSGLGRLGFDTVVDLSPYGVVGRAPHAENVRVLEEVSRRTGMHIVLGTATYLDSFSPAWAGEASLDELAARFTADLTEGLGDSPYLAGILGEQATGLGAIAPHEEAALRAAARAHVATGAGLVTHTTHGTMALEQVEILRSERVALDRVVIGHLDIQPSLDYLLRVLDTGVSIAFDTIGKQYWDFFLAPLPTDLAEGEFAKRAYYRPDLARARRVAELVDRGYERQLLLSQDLTGAEVYLNPATHGQWGLSYLGAVFVPLCIEQGVPESALEVMLTDNPRQLLTIPG